MPRFKGLNYYFKRRFALVLGFLLALGISLYFPATSVSSTETIWDNYGVPHIHAKTVPELFHSFGWAQMHSHGDLILRLYGQARGRAAEYWGEDYLKSDKWVRTMNVPNRAQTWYEAQTPEFRSYLDAFADGMNEYITKHPELIEDSVEVVFPIQATDILAHIQNLLYFTFIVNPQELPTLEEGVAWKPEIPEKTLGSNGWAIAPSRSESGNAMLLANPHLPWSDRFLWYEAELVAPGIDAYGASLVGVPVLNIAFNDNITWTHTINTYDGWDAYELSLTNNGYLYDGEVRPFEQETQTLKIKQEDGTLREETLTITRSLHGPIIDQKGEKAIALRVVGNDASGALEEWWDMARSNNLEQFESALKRLQIPLFTVLYADRDGHILHLFNGQVPIRSQGDFAYWQGLIPGDTSETLWTEYHSYEDLPRLLDPPTGWLQNANDPPWTTTFPSPLNPDDYPAYMAPPGPMWFRAQQSAQMLFADESISFAELVANKHSTEMELANRILDDLLIAVDEYGTELAQEAVTVLKSWDLQANPESRGAVLFEFWADAMNFSQLFAIPWNENAPLSTPDGLANPAEAVTTLETVAQELKTKYGSLDIAWGEVFRLIDEEVNVPASGAPGYLGVFRVLDFAPSADDQFKAIGGDSYVAVVEFSNPVQAKVLTSYGNATQPHLISEQSQLELFSSQQLRPVLRSQKDEFLEKIIHQ